jgi:hypothetical protein
MIRSAHWTAAATSDSVLGLGLEQVIGAPKPLDHSFDADGLSGLASTTTVWISVFVPFAADVTVVLMPRMRLMSLSV